jgi:hypothetical protein
MFWLSYERWDFADFGEFWYKLGGRTTGVGVQAGNRLAARCRLAFPHVNVTKLHVFT